TFENNHLFVSLSEGTFLLDTGAPTSFGRVSHIALDGQQFALSPHYLGLTPDLLSQYVGRLTDGILGADVLTELDTLIDLERSSVVFSRSPLECRGDELPLEDFMGIPIICGRFAGDSVRMFFDTGAQLSYLQHASLAGHPAEGSITDFYPGFGEFST